MRALAVACLLVACGGALPATRYYQLAPPAADPPRTGTAAVSIEPLTAETAYDDDRIVYRLTPYRLDYYQYQRWSAPPGALIATYLEQAFERSGRFRAVLHDTAEAAPVALGGRVVALEEVDATKTRWLGRVVLELRLSDSTTGDLLWTQQYEELEPLPERSPEGLARAISAAMQRIAARAAPIVAELAERQARAHEARAATRRP